MGLKDKILGFVAPVEDDGDEELEYTDDETSTVSQYEAPKSKIKVSSDVKMVLFEPRTFDEAEEIARHIKSRRAALVNLHKLQRDHAQRTIDFLTGVVFALDGSIKKVGHNIILCAPKSIGVDGQINLDNNDD